MKLFGLNLLTAILLLTQGMLIHGQAEQSYVEYSNGQTATKKWLFRDQCTPVVLPDGSRVVNAFLVGPMRCYNYKDAECTKPGSPPVQDFPQGFSAVPPDTNSAAICHPQKWLIHVLALCLYLSNRCPCGINLFTNLPCFARTLPLCPQYSYPLPPFEPRKTE